MQAQLFRGRTLVGTLELPGADPYVIKITTKNGGSRIKLADGATELVIPPRELTEVFTKRQAATLSAAGLARETTFHLVRSFDPIDPKVSRRKRHARSR